MTRPDKHAAHFGDRYQPAVDYRRLRKAMPAIKRITEGLRVAAERIRTGELHVVPSRTQPGKLALIETHIHVDDVPGANDDERLAEALRRQSQCDRFPAIVLGRGPYTLPPFTRTLPLTRGLVPPSRGSYATQDCAEPPDILDRIDTTLAYMTDAQTGRGDEPWPFRSF